MNPFRTLKRLRIPRALLGWPRLPVGVIPIERPPGSRLPPGRVHVLWYGDPTHAYPYEVPEPPAELDGYRLKPWF